MSSAVVVPRYRALDKLAQVQKFWQ